MALLTPTAVTKAGIPDILTPQVAADVAGDRVKAASGIGIIVTNGDASPHTLTVAAPSATTQCAGYGDLPLPDLTLVVAAGDTGMITIPLKYAVNSEFTWTYDDVTSVTLSVLSYAP